MLGARSPPGRKSGPTPVIPRRPSASWCTCFPGLSRFPASGSILTDHDSPTRTSRINNWLQLRAAHFPRFTQRTRRNFVSLNNKSGPWFLFFYEVPGLRVCVFLSSGHLRQRKKKKFRSWRTNAKRATDNATLANSIIARRKYSNANEAVRPPGRTILCQ
jgi:hypothetical protein